MNFDSGTNEKPLRWCDLVIKAEKGDLLQTPGVEDRVYLVLDKHIDIDHGPNTSYISVLSPEGVTLTGYAMLQSDMIAHGHRHRHRLSAFYVLPRSTSSSTR